MLELNLELHKTQEKHSLSLRKSMRQERFAERRNRHEQLSYLRDCQ